MYVMQIHLYHSHTFPLFCSAFHERMAEVYELPSIETLMKSLKSDVLWPGNAQVYYLENMREQNEKALFQVRFLPSQKMREHTSVFLSIESSQVHNITVQFPARGDRQASSKMIGIVKSLTTQLHISADDLQISIEGFMEMGVLRFIRETRLSGFIWIDGLQRYLHVSEDPRRIKEVQKGIANLNT